MCINDIRFQPHVTLYNIAISLTYRYSHSINIRSFLRSIVHILTETKKRNEIFITVLTSYFR